jgi:hypothetical protein
MHHIISPITKKINISLPVCYMSYIYSKESNLSDICSSLQAAWHNSEELQCFGTGQNIVPSVHIKDLAAYVYKF